jgi:hypothetical protein
MSLESVVRPFAGQDVTPTKIVQGNAGPSAPVRLVIGLYGGTKTFAYSGSSTLTSYMANVHTEKPSTAFDMTTGELHG